MTHRAARLPAFYDATGAVTRISADHVVRLAEHGLWLARVRRGDGSVVCEACLAAQEYVAPMTTLLVLRDRQEVVVLGHLDLVADALARGRAHTAPSLLTARDLARSIGTACLTNCLTATHNNPCAKPATLSLKPQRVADDDLDFLAARQAAHRRGVAGHGEVE